MSWVLLLLQTSFRNIFSSFLNVVIGLIILVGTLFFVVGGSLVNSMDKAMSRSIIGRSPATPRFTRPPPRTPLPFSSSGRFPTWIRFRTFPRSKGL